jgi:hypothetical protein
MSLHFCLIFFGQLNYNKMDVSHAILFLENADFVRITGLYFPAKFELLKRIKSLIMSITFIGVVVHQHLRLFCFSMENPSFAQ